MGTGALRPERRDACVERRIQDFSKSVTARYDHITQQLYGAHGLAAARRIETMAVPHDGVRYEVEAFYGRADRFIMLALTCQDDVILVEFGTKGVEDARATRRELIVIA